MKQKRIIQTLDDMIFENRFKDYGAYQLRKNYKANLTRALVIGVFPFLLLMLSSFWIQPEVTVRPTICTLVIPSMEHELIKAPVVIPDKPIVNAQIKEVQTVVIPTGVEPLADESLSNQKDEPTEEEIAG